MAAKFDVQVLKKNLFWILLGVAALFELILLVILPLSDPGAEKRKDYEETLKTTKGLTSGWKNEKFLPAWDVRKTEYEKEKNSTWAKAWNPQGGDSANTIYYSPPGMKQLIYPTDEITGPIRTDYKNKYYAGQFKNFEAEIQNPEYRLSAKNPQDWRILQGPTPISFGSGSGGSAGGGGGGGDGMMGMGGKPGGGPGGGGGLAGGPGGPGGAGAAAPTSGPGLRGLLEEVPSFTLDPNREEIWILQEDISIRREVVRLFRETVAEIGNMRRVDSPSNEPKAVVVSNAYWKVKLVAGTQGRIDQLSTIENVHAQHRPQALYDKAAGWTTRFEIAQPTPSGQVNRVEIKLEGDPVMYQQVRSFKDFPPMNIGTIDLSKPFAMVQLFDPSNCPIRRLEKVAMGRKGQSHRTMEAELKARNTLPAEKPAEGEADAAAAGGGDGMMGGMPGGGDKMAGMMMGGGPGGPGGGAPVGDLTQNNKIDRARYIVSNELCRHLPVGINVVVDQTEVPTVLTAIANSRMRMQITQVDWVHKAGVGGADGPMGGMPGMGAMGGMPGMGAAKPGGMGGGPGGPSGFPGSAPGLPGMGGPPGSPAGMPGAGAGEGGSSAMGAGPSSQPAQLVDLAVYAIASLYERYPPRPPSADGSGGAAPAAAAAPAGGI